MAKKLRTDYDKFRLDLRINKKLRNIMGKKDKKDVQEKSTSEKLRDQQEQQAETAAAQEETLSAEEGQILSELDEARHQLSEMRDKYLRLMAEFENYKKRTLKEKVDLMRTAAEDTMSALLPVLDDFDRARKMAEAEDSSEVFSEGVQLVYNKLYNVLKQKGLQPMDTEDSEFDPERHDAITEIPAPTEEQKGKVIDTIEKGYTLNDKIIRYAKVVVGR